MKKAISLFLTAALFVSSLCTTAFAEDKINIVVNGSAIDFLNDQAPIIQDNRVLVPFRAVFEKMGAEVQWFEDIKLCEATYAGATVEIEIGSTKVYLGEGATIESDVPAQIINGRTMVPLRVLSEGIGAEVKWDGETKTVTVDMPEIKEEVGESPESVEYEMTSEEFNSDDADVSVSCTYPVVTTDYTYKDKINKSIKENVAKDIETFLESYNKEEKNIAITCEVAENKAGLFSLSFKLGDDEVFSKTYGILNGAVVASGLVDIDLPKEDEEENSTYSIKTYSVDDKASDTTTYIIATVEYPEFNGDSEIIKSLNTQLENSAKKAADSFVKSYKEDSFKIYDDKTKNVFEPPYNLFCGCSVSVEENIAVITNSFIEVHYGIDDKNYTETIKVNLETGEVVE